MSTYADLDFFHVDVDAHGVALVRLNRPDRGNAYSVQDHGQMAVLFDRLEADDAVRATLLTGAGEDFSIGPDRDFAQRLLDEPPVARQGMAEVRQLVASALRAEKPIVAAINGRVVGGAVVFALLADIVIIEGSVTLRDIHIPAGIVAGDGGILVWVEAMGLTRAKRYLLTGDPVTAADAERLGLVTEVVEDGAALERARVYAERFAAGPADAIRATKRALHRVTRDGVLAAFEAGISLEEASMGGPDARRAMTDLMRGGPGVMPPDRPTA